MIDTPRTVRGLDAALRPALEVIADRLERRSLRPEGRVRLSGLSRESRHALSALIGRPVVRDQVTLDLAELDRIARDRLRMPGGIVQACEAVVGRPLVDRAARRRDKVHTRAAWHALLLELDRPWAPEWADDVARLGLLTRCTDPHRTATQAVTILGLLLGAASPALSRTELAARVAGSSHALDDGTILAAVVLRALARDADEPAPRTPAGRQQLWACYGVSADRVSTTVLALGLRATGSGRVARWLDEAADARAAVHLTATDLDELALSGSDEPVLVCENPRVLESAGQLAAPATLICGMGRPTTVVLRLLQQMRDEQIPMRYHGDFDWPGIAITNQLLDAVGAVPWRMAATDYLAGVARMPAGQPLSGAAVPTPWDRELAAAMQDTGVAVHEELLLPDLLHDW